VYFLTHSKDCQCFGKSKLVEISTGVQTGNSYFFLQGLRQESSIICFSFSQQLSKFILRVVSKALHQIYLYNSLFNLWYLAIVQEVLNLACSMLYEVNNIRGYSLQYLPGPACLEGTSCPCQFQKEIFQWTETDIPPPMFWLKIGSRTTRMHKLNVHVLVFYIYIN